MTTRIMSQIEQMSIDGKLHEIQIEHLAARRAERGTVFHAAAELRSLLDDLTMLAEAWRIRALAAESTVDGIERLFAQGEGQQPHSTRELKARIDLMMEVIKSYHEGR